MIKNVLYQQVNTTNNLEMDPKVIVQVISRTSNKLKL